MSLRAVIYIGSGSVAAGLVDDKTRELVAASEEGCHFADKIEPEMFLTNIADALKLALSDLNKNKLGSPEKVLVFLSSPFISGRLNILEHKLENNKNFKVTEKLIGDLTAQDASKFKKDPQHTVIDSKIMRFQLNGYVVTEPHGQIATSLEVAHYLSIAPSQAIKKFEAVIINAFHHKEIEWHAASFAAFTVARQLRPADQSFILLDVGAEVTELTLGWKGIIRAAYSYPLGYHALLRERVLGGEARASARTALELSLAKSESKAKTAWLAEFQKGLKEIVEHRFWSGEIVLWPEDEQLAPTLTEWLTTTDLSQIIYSARRVKVELLSGALLTNLLKIQPSVKASPSLLVMSLFTCPT